MAGIKISALPAIPSCALTDLIAEVQPASGGTTYKATLQQLLTLFSLNSGNVNAGTINQLAWYAASGNQISGLSTANSGVLITSAGGVPSISTVLPGGLTTTDPVVAQGIATKNYVDTIATGGGAPVVAASTGALTVTQAGAGVGATLTNAGAQATFTLDGQSPTVGQRVLIKNQSGGSNTQNGVYTVTNVGSGSSNWVLTRATDYDTPSDINNTGIIPVEAGTVNINTGWINTTLMVTVDTTAVTFIQFGVSFPVSLANGGTNASLTASNGGIFYSTASAGAILSGTATANQVLMSGASTTPAWSTATYPATTTINQLLFSGSSNVVTGLSTLDNGVLLTSATGVPEWLANGTANYVLTANSGAPPSWQAVSATGAITSVNIQVFTSTGANTYTPTSGTVYAFVELWGAGGGGGATNSSTVGGSGGGGGAYAASIVNNPTSVTISIGTGGTGQVKNAGTAGTAGGNTTYGSTVIIAAGGQPGSTVTGGAGGLASSSTGTITISGNPGITNFPVASTYLLFGGAAPKLGILGSVATGSNSVANSGAGGSVGDQTINAGNGGSGYAVVTEYISA